MPLISVIVPVYKVEPYLRRCVDSILAQTFTDFELILVDDGSPDNCGAICDEYAARDTRIHVIHQENGGLSAARNAGLDWVFANSDSEWISFVDSDDWVHPHFLELLYKGVLRYDVNICQCLYICNNGTLDSFELGEKISNVTPEELYTCYYSCYMWDKLFNKVCWQEIRFPEGQLFEDVATWYKILFREQRVALVKEGLYYYFQRPDGIVLSEWTPSKLAQVDAWEDQIKFVENYCSFPILKNALSRYCWVLRYQFEDIENSSLVSAKIKKQNKRVIKNKMRKVLYQYKSELKTAGAVLFLGLS